MPKWLFSLTANALLPTLLSSRPCAKVILAGILNIAASSCAVELYLAI